MNPSRLGSLLLVSLALVVGGVISSTPASATPASATPASSTPASAEDSKQLLWGDTHLHSSNSFDAYLNRNMSADPATAYRYAKGLPVMHAYHRGRIRIETPLDFLVVADHAEYLGVMRYIIERGIPAEDLGFVDQMQALYIEYWLGNVIDEDEGQSAFSSFLPNSSSVEEAAAQPPASIIPASEAMQRTVWQEAIQIADEFNEPGKFTAMIGWEWSSIPAGANLHRVVFTSSGADVASKFQPWSSSQSMYPEDLWNWLDETSARTGAEFVAMPHNSNISKGYMFETQTLRGVPFDAKIARQRLRWEPVVEVTQIKGDSETHPLFSPEDPFADFETYPYYIEQNAPPYDPKVGDYIRPALLRGLAIEEQIGFNPYRFGLIGSTDSHTGMASAEEPNFWGKFPRDGIPENKANRWRMGEEGGSGPSGWSMSASGLAAVWAEENSRDAILKAFRRREVYATTGPRIGARVFGGWDFTAAEAEAPSISEAGYARGVPMGGELSPGPKGAAPSFLVQVMRDPKSANLDRVQVIKGWIDPGGKTHERVYNVAWSGARTLDATGGLAPVGNTVDPETGRYTNDIGSSQFSALWRDPDFDPAQPAFYYVRALEIPTPRHSLFDALALGVDPKTIEGPWWIQERAYTSPIWYTP
ncbi:MAG TPA: DUF3604 domain-containing protein [Myxococcales bacterium]|nr:DUF3604 domain-containing protein [Myxococcales bacterium]